VGAITTSEYPGTDDPLTDNTWVQTANEDDLVLGAITYQSPSQCSTFYMPFLGIYVYVDGRLSESSFTDFAPLQPGGTTSFVIPIGFASAVATPHTLTVRAWDSCNTGAHYTVTALKLDVAAID
jgi:hypothetical protein